MAAPPAAIARLAAGAKGGTAGVKAYDQAQDAVKASSKSALAGLATDAKGFAGNTGGLEPTLRAEVAAPGGVALQNLARQGAAQLNADRAGHYGTNTYMDEARSAIPVIDAEARLEEAQREALLAASTQRSSAASSHPLSDSSLRTYLEGAAERDRAQQAHDAQAAAAAKAKAGADAEARRVMQQSEATGGGANQTSASRAQLWGTPTPLATPAQSKGTPAQPGGYGGPQQPFLPQTPAKPFVDTEAIHQQNEQRILAARQAALANIQQQQYGPGITSLAERLGVEAGIDPNRVAGLFKPSDEQSYLAANEKLGLYKSPLKTPVSNVTVPAAEAGAAVGLKPKDIPKALQYTYFDWRGDPTLNKAFKKWQDANPTVIEGKSLEQQQQAFEQSPGADKDAKNVVQDIIADANHAINNGLDYETWKSEWLSEPVAQHLGRTVAMGLAMVAPMFTYAGSHQRTYNPSA